MQKIITWRSFRKCLLEIYDARKVSEKARKYTFFKKQKCEISICNRNKRYIWIRIVSQRFEYLKAMSLCLIKVSFDLIWGGKKLFFDQITAEFTSELAIFQDLQKLFAFFHRVKLVASHQRTKHYLKKKKNCNQYCSISQLTLAWEKSAQNATPHSDDTWKKIELTRKIYKGIKLNFDKKKFLHYFPLKRVIYQRSFTDLWMKFAANFYFFP